MFTREQLETRRKELEAELGEPITVDALSARWSIFQRKKGHRHSTDDLLTAWYAIQKYAHPNVGESASTPRTYLDLGTGIGTVGLLVISVFDQTELTCIEAQDISFRFLTENIAANAVGDRVHAIHGDLRQLDLGSGSTVERFPLITGSPPYFDVSAGIVPVDSQKAHARFELRGDVRDYARAAKRHLTNDGLFVFCFPYQQRQRAIDAAHAEGFPSIQIKDVIPREGLAPLFSLYSCKGSPGATETPTKMDVETEPPFIVRNADGSHTQSMHDLRALFGFPPQHQTS